MKPKKRAAAPEIVRAAKPGLVRATPHQSHRLQDCRFQDRLSNSIASQNWGASGGLAKSLQYDIDNADSDDEWLAQYAPGGASSSVLTECCGRFSKDVLGITFWDRVLAIIFSVIDERRTAVRSGHSMSKSTTFACVLEWWWSARRLNVWTTAPGLAAVTGLLWTTVGANRKNAKRRLPGKYLPGSGTTPPWLKDDDPGHWATGFSTNKAERAQGRRNPGTLVLADESGGLEDLAWTALEAAMTDATTHMVALGNPNNIKNKFWAIWGNPAVAPMWKRFQISSLESPNISDVERKFFADVIFPQFQTGRVDFEDIQKRRPPEPKSVIPGMANLRWVIEQAVNWKDVPQMFYYRVLGEECEADGDLKTIPGAFINAAMDLWEELEDEEPYLLERLKTHCAFLDVAGQGVDRSALTYLRGQRFHVAKWWFDRSEEGLWNMACEVHEWIVERALTGDEPLWQGVDVDAIGAGVHSNLAMLRRTMGVGATKLVGGRMVNGKLVGAKSVPVKVGHWGRCHLKKLHWGWAPGKGEGKREERTQQDQFHYMVDSLYWRLRKALDPSKPRHERLAIPPGASHLKPDPLTRRELYEQLNVRGFTHDGREKIKVDGKEKLAVSPDVGDSLAGCMYRPLIVRGVT